MTSSLIRVPGPVAFVGAGNMAEALVRGLLRARALSAARVRVSDIDPGRRDRLRRLFGVRAYERNADCVRGARVVVLAVKPQTLAGVVRGLRPALPRRALVISIAAGVHTAWLERRLPAGMRVARAMPNLPARVRAGVSAYCLGRRAGAADARRVDALFRCVGRVQALDEAHMDAVTALSGSGPAYVFFLAEIMIEAGRAMGLPEAAARELTLATLRGAARLLARSRQEPGELRRQVTSRGGTTAAALETLERGRVRACFVRAIRRARARARRLSEAL